MTLLLIIISSILINYICEEKVVRLLNFTFSSLIVYYHFVGTSIVFVLLLILLTLTTKELIYKRPFSKPILLILYICLCIIGFISGKIISNTNIILPIGYSVVMFSGISLIIDESKTTNKYSSLESIAYLMFYPKILAGPIERSGTFISQLNSPVDKNITSNLYIGFKTTVFGCFLKYIITDNLILLTIVDVTGINQFISILLYAILFYFDFWAYSLLAVGISKMYGINVMMNFNNPYSATSFKDFWNKWNISLTTWLKDYIFIPLQMKGITSRSVNVFIVFLVSAIWHGITLPFLMWGLLHATFNILERNLISAKVSRTIFYKIIVVLSCALLWQTFKVNGVKELSTTISNLFLFSNINYTLVIILILLVAVLYMFERNWFKHYIFDIKGFKKKDIILEVLFISIMLLSLVFLNTNLGSPFHYFKY